MTRHFHAMTDDDLRAGEGETVIVGLGRSLLIPPPMEAPPPASIPKLTEALALAPAGTLAMQVAGQCTAPVLMDGDVVLLHAAPARRGDLVTFRVAGDLLGGRGKSYVGRLGPSDVSRALYGDHPGPFLLFQQWNPSALILAPLADMELILTAWGRIRDGDLTAFEEPPGSPWMRADIADIADPEPLATFPVG